MDIRGFWNAVLSQDGEKMKGYFREDAYINWHCSNEHFSVDEYIRVNCEYPGEWDGTIERIEQIGDLVITVVNVYTIDKKMPFHVVSFLKIDDEKIVSIDEYWGEDGHAPQWRLDKHIGTPIK